jgi:lipopolysaccharide/colanic/teichoic acid biosynthesis glycosyltransferase
MQNVLYNEKQPRIRLYATVFKPLMDRILGLILLVLMLPLLFVISLLVRINMGSPVLFSQNRAGYKGKSVKIYKFRTMTEDRDLNGTLLPDEERLTSFGLFMRRTSLDELPQLLNVIRGEISLIGPRPLLVDYLPLYTADQARRHDVKPGITGMAQVNGRNSIKWEEKFYWDTYYVDHVSFMLDMKILWWTFRKLVRSQDINQEGYATMPRFTGSQPSYIMTDVMKEVLISEKDWSATPAPVRSACQVMANRITILDRQLEHAHAEREIYRTQMLDMKARLDAALSMLQLTVPVDTTFDPAETWLDDADTQPARYEPVLDEAADALTVLRVVNMTVTQDQFA